MKYLDQQAVILKGIAQSLLDLSSPTMSDLNRLLKMFSLDCNVSSDAREEILYAFLYCPDYKQGGYITISVHRDMNKAIDAMNKHKAYCLENYSHIVKGEADWKIKVINILD
jgi:hypothetical protein